MNNYSTLNSQIPSLSTSQIQTIMVGGATFQMPSMAPISNDINLTSTSVGIIGLGFVGNAIRTSMMMMGSCTLKLIDSDPSKGGNHTYEDIKECDGVFVCVPTPQNDDGSCDTSILEKVLKQLHDVGYHGVIISKSTATPDVYERLNAKYPNLVHSPEFLTAARASADYAEGTFAIIGGKVTAYKREAERLIRMGQNNLQSVIHCTIGEASLAKYAINCFMSTKVIFMNELKQLADQCNLDYKKIAEMLKEDKRIGNSHMQVPGPDGHLGFGGACFPKDTSALLRFAEDRGIFLNVLDAAVKKNLILRLTDPK